MPLEKPDLSACNCTVPPHGLLLKVEMAQCLPMPEQEWAAAANTLRQQPPILSCSGSCVRVTAAFRATKFALGTEPIAPTVCLDLFGLLASRALRRLANREGRACQSHFVQSGAFKYEKQNWCKKPRWGLDCLSQSSHSHFDAESSDDR